MRTVLPTIALALACAATAAAQEAPTQDIEAMKAAMERLSFMVGTWEGTSSMRMGPGPAAESVGTERVEWRLGGLALLVHGEFRAPGAPESASPVHQALGVITYDLGAKQYRFQAHTAAGQVADSRGVFEDGVFEWRLPPTPQGMTVRYRLALDEDGDWHEVGEGSRDGETWFPFFEMKLRKAG